MIWQETCWLICDYAWARTATHVHTCGWLMPDKLCEVHMHWGRRQEEACSGLCCQQAVASTLSVSLLPCKLKSLVGGLAEGRAVSPSLAVFPLHRLPPAPRLSVIFPQCRRCVKTRFTAKQTWFLCDWSFQLKGSQTKSSSSREWCPLWCGEMHSLLLPPRLCISKCLTRGLVCTRCLVSVVLTDGPNKRIKEWDDKFKEFWFF